MPFHSPNFTPTYYYKEKGEVLVETQENPTPFITTSLPSPAISGEDVDFIEAAENTVHAVVHVKNVTETRVPANIFDFYYGSGGTPRTLRDPRPRPSDRDPPHRRTPARQGQSPAAPLEPPLDLSLLL